MPDIQELLLDSVKSAHESGSPLHIQGNQTKSFLTHDTEGQLLPALDHEGIVEYEPTELVVSARCGTTIEAINSVLLEGNQMLAFDPPRFSGQATLGGIVAAGLSGPGRPWLGAVRDHVLGTTIINGRGELLKFGGTVMKNVAGYDVSRLMVGAYGTLGLILEVSLKVLPLPEQEVTLSFDLGMDDALHKMSQWSNTPLPISGACWLDNQLNIRLAGTSSGIGSAARRLGGESINNNQLWSDLRDHTHSFFKQAKSVWRLAMAPATATLPLSGKWLLDWGGAQRWLISDEPADRIAAETLKHGGHYARWYDDNKSMLRTPLEPAVMALHQRLKSGFDPKHILNPGIYCKGI